MQNTVNGTYGTARKPTLTQLLRKFSGYTKTKYQSVDDVAADLQRTRAEIRDRHPSGVPSELASVAVLMNACQGSEFEYAKCMIMMDDDCTFDRAVTRLRTVELLTRGKIDLVLARFTVELLDQGKIKAKGKLGRPNRRQGRDLSNVQCYRCEEMGHLARNCEGTRKSSGDRGKGNVADDSGSDSE